MRRRRLGNKPISHDAGILRTLVGSTGGGSGPGPDDALYLTLSAHSDLTSERIFTPGDGLTGSDGGAGGLYTAAVDLSATSGLEFSGGDLQIADSIAGAGLGISSKVLAVGAGDGIDVAANSVAVDLSATSGLEFSGGDLQVADSIAGAGLAISSKILAVGAGTLITVNADDVALSNGSAQYQVPVTGGSPFTPAWTALSTFAGGGLGFSAGAFVVNVGDGLEVATDTVKVDLVAAWSGLEFSGGDLRADLGAVHAWTADHSWDADTLAVDVSEDAIYVNVPGGLGSPPTYRGAVTVRPTDANQKAQVIQAFASQNANLWEVRDSAGALDLRVTQDGDLESGDFTSGVSGWGIDAAGNAEFWNAWIRGELHATTFVADEMHATGGTLAVMTASKVSDPKVAADNKLPAGGVGNSFTLVVQASWDTGLCYVADNHVLRIKSMAEVAAGGSLDLWDIWLEVDGTPSSNGDRDLANGLPGTFDVNCIWRQGGEADLVIPPGAAAVHWGTIGAVEGGLILTSDLNYSPYVDIFTVPAATPWSAGTTPRVRVGNLDGVLGLSEQWGIAGGKDLSDDTEPHVIISNQQVGLYGVAQTWWDSGGIARASVDPTAGAADKLFWAGPSSADPQFIVYGDGDVWLSTLAISADLGAWFFSQADGLLLLGPGCKITDDKWTSTRGQEADISGAFHQEAGPWAESRGLVVEEAGLNYEPAPRMIEDGVTGLALGWTYVDGLGSGGSASLDVGVHFITERGWMQRIDYSGAAGDVNDDILIYNRTAAASFAAGEDTTCSFDVKGTSSGVLVQIECYAENAANGVLGSQTTTITLTHGTQRVQVTYENLPANTDHVRVQCGVREVDNGDEVDIWFGAVNTEKAAYATTFMHGGLDWCAWSGTADQSTTTRAATTVNLDAHVGLLDANNTLSICGWAQVLYDANDDNQPAVNPEIFDIRKIGDNNNRILFRYQTATDTWAVYINGADRLISGVQTHEAGDWIQYAIVLDFTNDEYTLSINGSVEDTDTTALVALTGLDAWALGDPYVIGEFAVLDSILTENKIAAHYASGKPLADAGAIEKPGIYILDGRISLASSTTGARWVIDDVGIRAYSEESGNPQSVNLAVDGDFFLGSDISAAATTALCVFANAQTYNSEVFGVGDVLFGDNSASKANMLWDVSAGKLLFRGGTTMQVEIGTDGELAAGGGKVTLSTGGLRFDANTLDDNARVQWYNSTYSVMAAHLAYDPGTRELVVTATGLTTGQVGDIILFSDTQGGSGETKLTVSATTGMFLGTNVDSDVFSVSATGVVRADDYVVALGGIHVGGASDPGTDNLLVDGYCLVTDYVTASGGVHVGGTSDPGTDNLIVDGFCRVTDYMTASGGVHVGGISDPGPDNLLVDGDCQVTGEIQQGATDYGAYEIQTGGQIYCNDYILAIGGLSVGSIVDPGNDLRVINDAIFGSSADPSYRLEVIDNVASDFAASFFNDGNNADRYGIVVQSGDDAGNMCYSVTCRDGDATSHGGLRINTATVELWQSSDVSLKENITDTTLGLRELMQLRVREFNWRDGPGQHDCGFVAQEAQGIIPNFVVEGGPDREGLLTTAPTRLIPILVRAIQEQQEIIQQQRGSIRELQNRRYDETQITRHHSQ